MLIIDPRKLAASGCHCNTFDIFVFLSQSKDTDNICLEYQALDAEKFIRPSQDTAGPPNIASCIDFIEAIEKKIALVREKGAKNVIVTAGIGSREWTDTLFLLGAYMIVNLKVSNTFISGLFKDIVHATGHECGFDLSSGATITVLDCWGALARCRRLGWIRLPSLQVLSSNRQVEHHTRTRTRTRRSTTDQRGNTLAERAPTPSHRPWIQNKYPHRLPRAAAGPLPLGPHRQGRLPPLRRPAQRRPPRDPPGPARRAPRAPRPGRGPLPRPPRRRRRLRRPRLQPRLLRWPPPRPRRLHRGARRAGRHLRPPQTILPKPTPNSPCYALSESFDVAPVRVVLSRARPFRGARCAGPPPQSPPSPPHRLPHAARQAVPWRRPRLLAPVVCRA